MMDKEVSRSATGLNHEDKQTLFLVRHRETEWSRKKLYQGQSDPPLSGEGIEQAELLSRRLAPRLSNVTRVFSSPLARARMTASPIARLLNQPVEPEPLLSEMNYGAWEGLTQVEIKARWPDLYRNWKQEPATMTFPGGESLQGLKDRVLAFLNRVRNVPGSLLIVTHLGVLRVALVEAMGAPLSQFRAAHFRHGSLLEICRHDGRLRVVAPFWPMHASGPDPRGGKHRFGATEQRHAELDS